MDRLIHPLSEEYRDYLRDESRNTGSAQSISFPENLEQLQAVMDTCRKNAWRVTVQCARTGISGGACPDGGHIINLSRYNKIIGYKNENNQVKITVQPGVPLTELRKYIDETVNPKLNKKVFFPTDPTEATAGLGGITACNASGAKSYLYGSVRQYVTGLKILLSTGRLIHLERGEIIASGRNFKLETCEGDILSGKLPGYEMPSVKNAAGYFVKDHMDMLDIFIGSDGTLGIIYEIELGTLPLNEFTWGATAFFAEEQMAFDYVDMLKAGNSIKPAAIEFFNGDAVHILKEQRAVNPAFSKIRPMESQYHTAVYIELHGNHEEEMTARLLKAGDFIESCGGSKAHTWLATNESDLENLLFFRHGIPECVNMLIDKRKKKNPAITKLGTDLAVPGPVFRQFAAMYNDDLKSAGLASAIWGHIGDNHVHVNILPASEEEYAAGKALHEKWAKAAAKAGGTVSGEHGVGKTKAPYLRYMYGEEGIREMRALKKVFDPACMLNNGNMFLREDA